MPISFRSRLLSAALFPTLITAPAVANTDVMPLADQTDVIVVTATGSQQNLQDAPASISVVTRNEIELIGGGDLTDTLSSEPGVVVTGVGTTRKGISVRGMPETHTLYLVDGMRVSATNGVIAHSDAELGWVAPVAIERVEVVRGPMSSLYGSDALGGVVNIITRSPSETLFGEISAGYAAHENDGGDTAQGSAYLAAPIIEDRLGVSLSATYLDRDDVPDMDDPAISEIEGRESYSARAGLDWTPDDQQTIKLSYLYTQDDRWRDTRSGGRTPVDYQYRDDIQRELISASHDGQWSWGETRLSLYRSRTERENERTAGQTPTRDQNLQDTIVEGFTAFDMTARHRISLGAQWRVEELEDEVAASSGTTNAEQYALFVQDEISLTERLSVVAGVRGDHHDSFGWEVSPRLYVVHRATDRLTLKAGYGEGFKSPSLTDMSADYEVLAAGGRFWVEGNPDLEPETSQSFEVTAEYAAEGWRAHLGVFRNELSNLIESQCYVACGQRGQERRRYDNISQANINGAEAVLDVNLPANFFANLNYTYLDTENEETGEELENRSNHTANLSLGWTAPNSAIVQLRTEFRGDQKDSSGATVPDYTLFHVDAAWPLTEQVRLNAGIDNLLDLRLAERSPLYAFAEPGRVVRASLTYTF